MEATDRQEHGLPSRRAVQTIAAVAVLGLLVLLPGAATFVGALHAESGARSAPSGLSSAWDKPVYFIETGLAAGTAWSVNMSGSTQSSNGTEITFSEIPGTYAFSVFAVPGYSADPASGNVTLNDCMATVYITFTPVQASANYSVWFNETGLPSGTGWWAAFDGTNTSASTASISFSVPNGTYVFTTPADISGGAGTLFLTSVTNGTVNVTGADVAVAIPYSTEYYLTMVASPPGAGTITPGSGWYAAGSAVNISAAAASGYSFVMWNGSGVGGYSGTDLYHFITINAPIVENATFGVNYEVQFEETGLLDGIAWTVTLTWTTGTVSQSAYFVFLDFFLPNGTYDYAVTPIPGYHADSYGGTVTVAGSDVTVVIHWVRVTYNVTFLETGLPSGATWSVTLNGTTESNDTSTILFVEGNYTYPWSVSPISGYTSNVTGGTLIVNGADVQIDILFSSAGQAPATYTVTFVETGLSSGSYWSVTLNATDSDTQGSPTTSLAFSGVPDGSYSFWVPDVGGYQTANTTGTVNVSGGNVTVDVAFSALGPAVTHPGGTQISEEALVIFALIAVGGMIAAYLIYRRE
jgi:hypothetical protein